MLEIGPGTEKSLKMKTIPFLQILKPKHYTAVDINTEYAVQAAECIKDSLGIKHDILNHDAFQKKLDIPQDKKCKCILFLGSTIGNLIHDELCNFLNNLSNTLKEEDFLILSVDSNKDVEKLKRAYYNQYTHELALNAFRYFKYYTNLKDFDAEAFDFEFFWNIELSCVELMLKATKNQSFTLGDEKFKILKGQRCGIIFSKKFFLSEISYIVESYGFNLIDAFSIENNPIILTVFQKGHNKMPRS